MASAAGNGVAHIDIDASGDVYAAIGSSVVKLNPDGKSAAYTFSGGTSDFASDLAVDSQGAAWIAGQVGNEGGFIRKLSPDGSGAAFYASLALYPISASSVAVDAMGRAYVGGIASQIALTSNAIMPSYCSGTPPEFLT